MKEVLMELSDYINERVNHHLKNVNDKKVNGFSSAGDAQFGIDIIAEQAVETFFDRKKIKAAVFTEEGKIKYFSNQPEYLFIIDPIDGTRPAAAHLEMAMVSIAVASYKPDACLKDIRYGLLRQINNGSFIYADNKEGIIATGCHIPPLKNNSKPIHNLFWSLEFNGHPAHLVINSCGSLIDKTANTGGVFVFNSASFSITRIITGQLDAYVDVGNRLLKDDPTLLAHFQSVGNGKVLHLFPYDIAASYFIAKKAGIVITDAYGNDMDKTLLTDLSYQNQQSCIAASDPYLHEQIMNHILWN